MNKKVEDHQNQEKAINHQHKVLMDSAINFLTKVNNKSH